MVLHNMMGAHQGVADMAPNPGNDGAIPQNQQAVYVPNENYMNPSREAKHQQELLKDYFNHGISWVGRQDLRCVIQQPCGQNLVSVSPFQDHCQSFSELRNYSKNFYLKLVLHKCPISKPNPIHFQRFLKLFPLLETLNPSCVK